MSQAKGASRAGPNLFELSAARDVGHVIEFQANRDYLLSDLTARSLICEQAGHYPFEELEYFVRRNKIYLTPQAYRAVKLARILPNATRGARGALHHLKKSASPVEDLALVWHRCGKLIADFCFPTPAKFLQGQPTAALDQNTVLFAVASDLPVAFSLGQIRELAPHLRTKLVDISRGQMSLFHCLNLRAG